MNDWYTFFFARDNFESRRDIAYTENFNLEKARELYALAEEPSKNARFLHVAGTNGKGSTCFYLEQGLLAACTNEARNGSPARAGLFMSPHVENAAERIRVQGQPVSGEEMRWAAEQLAERIPENARATAFEMLFLAALLLFEKHACSWVVLETGVGGRLDTTNIMTPEISVITPIALDHTALLGPDLPSIAREKAGIIKAGVPVVSARQTPEARDVLRARALDLGSPYYENAGYSIQELGFRGALLTRADGSKWQTKMPGAEQAANLDLALTALAILGIAPDPDAFKERLSREFLPARLEYCAGPQPFLIDGAHNPQALERLAAFIARRRAEGIVRECIVITAMMADKDIAGNMHILEDFAETLILTPLAYERAAGAEELLRYVRKKEKCVIAASPEDALTLARARADELLRKREITGAGCAGNCKDTRNYNYKCFSDAPENGNPPAKVPQPLIVITGSFMLAGSLRGPVREQK